MIEARAQVASPVLVIGEKEGDGPALRFTPPPFKGILRNAANRIEGMRAARLMRVAQHIYPVLQKIEDRAMPEGDKILQGESFEDVLADDRKIERALRLFVSAWKSNFIRLIDHRYRPIPIEKGRTYVGACGLTIEQAEMFFIDRALSSIFKSNQKSLRHLLGMVHDPSALPKLRVLAHLHQDALSELMTGLRQDAGHVITHVEPDVLYAVATLKPFHLRALRGVMASNFKKVLQWSPDLIRAIGEHIVCIEQVVDLSDGLTALRGPNVLKVLAQWDVRDITDRVNEERASRGLPVIEGRRFETDIGVGRRVLGNHFDALLVEPAELVAAFGILIADIRRADKVQRKDLIEEARLLFDRYWDYLDSQVILALGVSGNRPTTFSELLYICEGLFSKPGVGRKFFEGPMKSRDGLRALHGLKTDIVDMQGRGAIKSAAEIKHLLSASDMLDKHISQFIKLK